MSQDFLHLAETFYSIQGEGPSMGRPAVFLRLAGCNLQCNGFSYQDPDTGEHLGCDSKLVWRKGNKVSFTDLLAQWQEAGFLDALDKGAHLIITGGEPLLQQERLIRFLNLLDAKPYIEIETNATKILLPEFIKQLNQINASPKLPHSGETKASAYKSDVLQQLADNTKTIFKFVVATPDDIDMIIADYVTLFNIARERIWLMPEGGTHEKTKTNSVWLIELCKQHCFNYSARLQIHIWDEVTGV